MKRWRFSLLATALMCVGVVSLPAAAQGNRDVEVLFESPNRFNAVNSDLAFWGSRAFVGNYSGFRIFDVEDPANPRVLSDFECFGPQNDVSVYDGTGDGEADLLFLSVDAVLSGPQCGSRSVPSTTTTGWEGIRVFDVSDPTRPQFVTAVYQDCGSHTHTLIPDPDNGRVLLLNSSYPLGGGPTCGPTTGPGAGRDPLHGVIQVVEVPLADPAAASELTELPIQYPGDTDNLWDPAEHGGFQGNALRGCHDIAVFLPFNLVAGACVEQAQMWRLDPKTMLPNTANPMWVFDDPVDLNGPTGAADDPEVAVDFWHSATFTWDGRVVNFIDESFSGFVPGDHQRCPPVTPGVGDTGRAYFLNARTGKKFSHFMIDRPERGYCSAHLGNVVPAKGRDLLVNAWYQGGVNVVDFTNPRKPEEIAFLDHPPEGPAGSFNWAAYWYETSDQASTHAGKSILMYGNDGRGTAGRGFQIFEATVGPTRRIGLDYLNPQTQDLLLGGLGRRKGG